MVRVFSTYHYGDQTVHPLGDEETILASAIMDDDHLILAKVNHCIEIVSLSAGPAPADKVADELDGVPTRSNELEASDDGHHNVAAQSQQRRNTTLSFPTLDRVYRLLYCKQGKRLDIYCIRKRQVFSVSLYLY